MGVQIPPLGTFNVSKRMNKKELITKLKELVKNLDYEYAHGEADNLLIEYINDKEILMRLIKLVNGMRKQ